MLIWRPTCPHFVLGSPPPWGDRSCPPAVAKTPCSPSPQNTPTWRSRPRENHPSTFIFCICTHVDGEHGVGRISTGAAEGAIVRQTNGRYREAQAHPLDTFQQEHEDCRRRGSASSLPAQRSASALQLLRTASGLDHGPDLRSQAAQITCTSWQTSTQRPHLMHFSRSMQIAADDCRTRSWCTRLLGGARRGLGF
jgi:hypothetical protein